MQDKKGYPNKLMKGEERRERAGECRGSARGGGNLNKELDHSSVWYRDISHIPKLLADITMCIFIGCEEQVMHFLSFFTSFYLDIIKKICI